MEILALLLFSLCTENAHYADIMLDAPTIALCPKLIYLTFSNSSIIHKGN